MDPPFPVFVLVRGVVLDVEGELDIA